MRFYFKKGQSMLEYGVLLALILASLLIMQFYVKRGYQGRLKQEADQLGQQYAPRHTASSMNVTTNTTTTTYTGGKTQSGVEVLPGETVTYTDTQTTSERQEGVDAFAAED